MKRFFAKIIEKLNDFTQTDFGMLSFVMLVLFALMFLCVGSVFCLRQFDVFNSLPLILKIPISILIPSGIALALTKLMPD